MNGKSPDAFRTISEVADWLGVNTHVLRFWESKFSQVKPVKRAGGRRYYRPADMELLGGIQKLLHEDGMTIKGVQKVLRDQGVKAVCAMSKPVDAEADEMPALAAAPQPASEPVPVPDEPVAPPAAAQAPDESPETSPEVAPESGTPPAKAPPMPLFSHRVAPSPAGTADAPAEKAEALPALEPDAMAEPDTADLPEAASPAPTAPVIAPLPTRDIPLAEALAMLRPRQISPEKLAPIHAGMIALRERMGSTG